MLNNLRYRIAIHLNKRSLDLINRGGFNNIKKGLKYFKLSVMIVPPSKELSEFGDRLRKTAEEKQMKLYEDQG